MKKGIIVMLLATILMTGCGDIPYSSTGLRRTDAEPEVSADVFQATGEKEMGEKIDIDAAPEALQVSEYSETDQESVTSQEYVADQELVASQEPEEALTHVCRMDADSTVTVLAFGEHEPDCFYGAKYDVKCGECGKYLDTIYRESLGHAGDEGIVTCQPDCTGGGSIRYTCIRCGAEWSEEYGQVQPHKWVEGIRKETDWVNGGTKEVSYLYCSVCGKREESE